MVSIKHGAALLSVLASLALAPAALASGGGVNSGGVNSGGGTTTTTTTTTGGGGGGGGGKVCTVSSLSNSVGYYSVYAAIWTSFGVTGCPGGSIWQMDFHNDITGAVDFTSGGTTALRGGTAGGTIDEDWAAFSTPYTVTLDVSGVGGSLLTSRSAPALTPDARPGA